MSFNQTERRVPLAIAALLLSSVFASSSSAQAVRTWVSTEGVDTAACTRAAPCRTFNVAINAVNPGGEVVPLDSGGYGPFSIDKSVSIIVPKGIHAAVAPTQLIPAVTVQAGPLDRVTLRGLFLRDAGAATRGISFNTGRALHVESCVVADFPYGIYAQPPPSNGYAVFVSDTTIRGGTHGIIFGGENTSSIADGIVDRCRLLDHAGAGVRADRNSRIAIRYTVVSGSSYLFETSPAVSVYGTSSNPGDLMMDHCVVTGNSATGVHADFGGTLRLRSCSVTDNGIGVAVDATATAHSLGDNLVSGNGTNVTGTLTVIPGK